MVFFCCGSVKIFSFEKLNFEDFPGATCLSKLLKPGSLLYRSNKCFRLVVNILKLKILFFFWYRNLGRGRRFTTRKTRLKLRYFVYAFLYSTVMNTICSYTNKPKANGCVQKANTYPLLKERGLLVLSFHSRFKVWDVRSLQGQKQNTMFTVCHSCTIA